MKIANYRLYLEEKRPVLVAENYVETDVEVFNNPERIGEFLNKTLSLSTLAEEYAYMIALDIKLVPLGIFEISHGTNGLCILNAREILMRALMCGASYIVVVHNHPSGDPTPSDIDIESTKKLYSASKLLGVQLVDHLIAGNYIHSMMEQNQECFSGE